MDELNACEHMSKDNGEIIEHTVHEILKSFKKSQARRRTEELSKGNSPTNARTSNLSKFGNAARKTTMLSRKTTIANLDQVQLELSSENRRLKEALNDAIQALGISKEKQQELSEAATELKTAQDDITNIEYETETLQTEIDEMDSMLFRFNASKNIKGQVELGDLSSGGNHDFESISRDEERNHRKLEKNVEAFATEVSGRPRKRGGGRAGGQ
jgi:hypothetical protein